MTENLTQTEILEAVRDGHVPPALASKMLAAAQSLESPTQTPNTPGTARADGGTVTGRSDDDQPGSDPGSDPERAAGQQLLDHLKAQTGVTTRTSIPFFEGGNR